MISSARLIALMTTAGCIVLGSAPGTAAYTMPLRGENLGSTERFNTRVHTAGVQAQGKDIGAVSRRSDGSWQGLKTAGADRKILNNWLVYGKKVYAMGDGVVVGCWRNAPENVPGSYNVDYKPNFKMAGGGNHLWVLQDDGVYALYAHMQPGSVPATLCPHNAKLFTGKSGKGGSPDIEPEAKVVNGARVTAGQQVGLVGNSGASEGGPHLHVHMEKGGAPIAMTFARGMTTSFEGGSASLDGPWTPTAGKEMPSATILFWPPRTPGAFSFSKLPDEAYQRNFEHLTDSGLMPALIGCKTVGNQVEYDGSFVPATGAWRSQHGMTDILFAATNAKALHDGYKMTSDFTCKTPAGNRHVTVWRQ